MPTDDEMKFKVRELVGRNMPSVHIVRIDAEPIVDSHGEKSLSIAIIVKERPSRDETRKLARVVGEFRSWLAANDDERFPYFRLLSEEDEREISQIAS